MAEQLQRLLRIALEHGRGQLGDAVVAGRAEQAMDLLGRQPLAAERQQLIEQRLGVAHRAAGPAGDQFQGFVVGLHPFAGRRFPCSRSTIRGVPMPAKSKRWQRDRMVIGIFSTSVVAKMNLTCGGGSSSVLSRALKAALDSMWTSSMM